MAHRRQSLNVLHTLALGDEECFMQTAKKTEVLQERARKRFRSEFHVDGRATANARLPVPVKLCKQSNRVYSNLQPSLSLRDLVALLVNEQSASQTALGTACVPACSKNSSRLGDRNRHGQDATNTKQQGR